MLGNTFLAPLTVVLNFYQMAYFFHYSISIFFFNISFLFQFFQRLDMNLEFFGTAKYLNFFLLMYVEI